MSAERLVASGEHAAAGVTPLTLLGLGLLMVVTVLVTGFALRGDLVGGHGIVAVPAKASAVVGTPLPTWLPTIPAAPAAATFFLSAPTPSARRLAALALATAGLVHARVVPSHIAESTSHGAFFALVAALQITCFAALWRRYRPRVTLIVVCTSAWLVALWAMSRTTGIALITGREDVGALDFATVVLEVAVVIVGSLWLRKFPGTGGRRVDPVKTREGTRRDRWTASDARSGYGDDGSPASRTVERPGSQRHLGQRVARPADTWDGKFGDAESAQAGAVMKAVVADPAQRSATQVGGWLRNVALTTEAIRTTPKLYGRRLISASCGERNARASTSLATWRWANRRRINDVQGASRQTHARSSQSAGVSDS